MGEKRPRRSIRGVLFFLLGVLATQIAGQAFAQGSLSPSQLTFPDTIVGTPSASQSILLTNTGSMPVLLSGYGFDAAGFFITQSDCPLQTPGGGVGALAVGATCTIQVQFKPFGPGPLNVTFNVYVTDQNNNFLNQPTVILSGTGIKNPAGSAEMQAIIESAFPNPVPEGGTVTIRLGMTTWGPDPVTNAVLALAIPPGYTLVSCFNSSNLAPCDHNGLSPTITVASLDVARGVPMTAVVKVPTNVPIETGAAGPMLKPMTYTVSATSKASDPVPGNNSVSGTVSIIPPSAAQLSATSLDFGLQLEHYMSVAKKITLTSAGPSPLLIGAGGPGISIQG